MHARIRHLLPALAGLIAIAGQGGCAAKVDSGEPPAGQGVSVAIDPTTLELAPGQAAQFAAAVTGSANVSVVWSIDETAGGTVDQAGLYTAPGAAGGFHVRATSAADPGRSAVAAVTVIQPPPAVAVAVSPKITTVSASGSVTFTASVTGTTNTAVRWSVQEASGCGSVTAAGVYTAPAAAASCHVVATSSADSSRSDVATVTVTAPVAVSITPATGTVDACKTVTFGATVSGSSDQSVTWSVQEGASGGSVSTSGVYTAPSTAGTYHVIATSRASSSAKATATVTVQDRIVSVAVQPATVSVTAGSTQQFTATVTTSCGTFTATQSVAALQAAAAQ